MRTIEVPDLEYLTWRKIEEDGHVSYVDRDGFSMITVVVASEFNGTPVATVLFDGLPVFIMCGEDYRYFMPTYDDMSPEVQSVAAFLLDPVCELHTRDQETGEDTDGPVTFVAEGHTLDEAYDRFGGDGHGYVGFAGMIARALYAAYPEHLNEPRGW